VGDALGVALLALALWVIAGVGFANYDTLYGLVWGQQAAHGHTPTYDVPIAPTPHPLVEVVGFVLTPFGPSAMQSITVGLGFLALAGCGVVLYRLGALWFGRAAGLIAAVLLLTRVPIVSYGVRAYVDVPYLLCVLGALLVESRRRHAGAPVLGLLAIAGLLRPEAWAFSGLYWLYLWPSRSRGEMLRLAALAASAPLVWFGSDLLVTGNPLWSLTHTRDDASTLGRVSGIVNVPEYIPRRIGETLGAPELAAAALGGVMALWCLRDRARLLAVVGVIAVAVFALFATAGLPINTRYAFFAAAILCVFCGAGLVGWRALESGDPRRRWWMAASALVAVGIVAFIPSQVHDLRGQLSSLSGQQTVIRDLSALVHNGAISAHCLPVGVPNHAPVPQLALELITSPANVVSGDSAAFGGRAAIVHGTYVQPADKLARSYILDKNDPATLALTRPVPSGFTFAGGNRSWRVYRRCAAAS
jgi:hypothetical protein